MRIGLKIAAVVGVIYLALLGGLLAAMYQPPDTFGRIMARAPTPVFFLFPFKPLWFIARAGTLRVGDPAPDFSLETPDKSRRVELSAIRGQKPVVLVFGSYT